VRIGEFASRNLLPIAPHCALSPLAFIAAAHVCAASSNVMCLEFHGTDVPFWSDLVDADGPIIANGSVSIPTGPGLGVELNLDTVRRYAAPGQAVFDEPPVR
jgi:galactonate dehydratase